MPSPWIQKAIRDLDGETEPVLKDYRENEPQRIAYLERMIAGNVTWWQNKNEWGQMVQHEILDRGLVTKGSVDHKLIMQLLTEKRGI